MGWLYGHKLESPGKYLLGILESEGPVKYSRFYCRDTDYAALTKAAGVDEDDEEIVHLLIELAAAQLEDAGIVLTTKLDTLLDTPLIDGEQDYRIELTDKGREFIKKQQTFNYRDMDL